MTINNDYLKTFCLRLADNSFVLSHRLCQLASCNATLEEDIAVANISLDLLGAARIVYQHLAEMESACDSFESRFKSEDDYVYLRDEREYLNVKLVEQPNTDFAYVMARQLFFDTYMKLLYRKLQTSSYEPLKQLADKAIMEVRYHHRHSTMWVKRLGDGTDESHARMQAAVDGLYTFTGELFAVDEVEQHLSQEGVIADPASLWPQWRSEIELTLKEATLRVPDQEIFMAKGGRNGIHTEHLGPMLAELQYLHRAHPGVVW